MSDDNRSGAVKATQRRISPKIIGYCTPESFDSSSMADGGRNTFRLSSKSAARIHKRIRSLKVVATSHARVAAAARHVLAAHTAPQQHDIAELDSRSSDTHTTPRFTATLIALAEVF
jgi:hypothetical protein